MRPMYKEKSGKQSLKPEAHACGVVIHFPRQELASTLEKDMKTGVPKDGSSKKYDLSREGNVLSIRLHNVQDTNFCGAFLLALSARVKKLVMPKHEESGLSVEISGADESGAALCVASQGLWPARFSFSSKAEKEKFDHARKEIDTQIKTVTKALTPKLKQEIDKQVSALKKGKKSK
ncbi:MAG: hypothetical protein RLZ35_179 [Pseudomonadota bacterium]